MGNGFGSGSAITKSGQEPEVGIILHTLPKHGYPSERIVRMALQDQQEMVLSKSMSTLLLRKLLAGKIGQDKVPKVPSLAA